MILCFNLNEYFCNVASSIHDTVSKTNTSHMMFMSNSNAKTIFLEAVTNLELSDVTDNLKLNKSPGNDNIGPEIVFDFKKILLKPLSFIYNLSISTGTVPAQMKLAKVIPVYKKGDRCSPGNYRPISMLSVFDKMLEKLMYKRLISFLEKHDILNKHQFGFRTGHSTTHALVEVMDELYANLDVGNFALGVFLDLQKAFDTMLHDLLLDKMHHYGIRGLAHSWFQSYLSNRTQCVSLNGVVSEPRHIRHGVPQGSVLGPLLFLLFINDITNIDPRLKIKLFADDTNIFFYDANLPNLIIDANVALDKIAKWLKPQSR